MGGHDLRPTWEEKLAKSYLKRKTKIPLGTLAGL
jgi:hypothetical protein